MTVAGSPPKYVWPSKKWDHNPTLFNATTRASSDIEASRSKLKRKVSFGNNKGS